MSSKLEKGCVQVYTGDGKGKTTAAAGLALRAAGAGLRVFIGQFIKGEPSSEMTALQKSFPGIVIEQYGLGRFIRREPSSEDIEAACRGVEHLCGALASGDFDLVIADEANGALEAGVIGIDDLLALLDARPADVELVITGRKAHPKLIERADLVTEMRAVKHYFESGVPARKGMEF